MSDGSAVRFNQNKIRYDLLPAFAQEQYASVLTFGAKKYGDHNWKKGMQWTTVLASLERHLEAIKKGEDYDKETGFLHSAHVMCNAGFLTEYYKIYPQGDDRKCSILNLPNIAIEVDGVLRDSFTDAVLSNLKFMPVCYISSGDSTQWLKLNGFPSADVILYDENIVEVLKEKKISVVISGNLDIFFELNKKGIFCYLFDSPSNKWINVGHRRLNSLEDLHF